MKKNYEKNEFIFFVAILSIFIFIIMIVSCNKIYYRTYKVITSTVISDKYLRLIISDNNYKILKKTKYLYIDNKKVNRRIISINRNILKRKKEYYHDVIIKINKKYKYKENDNINLTIYDKKDKLISIFKLCWR